VNALFEKLKDSNLFQTFNNNNNNNSIKIRGNSEDEKKKSMEIDFKKGKKHQNNDINDSRTNSMENSRNKTQPNFKESKKSNNKNENLELFNKTDSNNNDNKDKTNRGIIKKLDFEDKNLEKDEFISIDKLHETPIFNKDNKNIYSNFKNDYILNENKENGNFDKNIYENNNIKDKVINNTDNNFEKSKEIEKLQNELEKIKNTHMNSNNTSKTINNNINIIDNYDANKAIERHHGNNKSNRESDYNDISLGNITSSYDWELESNRKDKDKKEDDKNIISNMINKFF